MEKEMSPDEIDQFRHQERTARRDYYQKMEKNSISKEESLKWIRKIKKRLKD